MYLQGAGITRNYIRAYMWFHLGEMKGDRAAKKNRAFVETKMNSEEIIEANKQVEEWIRRYGGFKSFKRRSVTKSYLIDLEEMLVSAELFFIAGHNHKSY